MVVYLEEVRSPFNVGSMFRTAEAFGAQRILLSARTPLPSHPRALETALGAESVLPWERADLGAAESLGGVFALSSEAPRSAALSFQGAGVLVGSEELGLSPDALGLADRSRAG